MPGSSSQLRLASYNLHKCRGMTGPHAPERNLRVIAELGADVVALQEVDFRFGARPEALPRALIEDTTGMVPAPFLGTGENSLAGMARPSCCARNCAAAPRSAAFPCRGSSRGAPWCCACPA